MNEEEELERYCKENNIKTLQDFIDDTIYHGQDELIETLKICDYDPVEFFSQCSPKHKSEWFEKIDKTNIGDIIESKNLNEKEKHRIYKWIKKYVFYRTNEIKNNCHLQYHSTVKEQLYILQLLKEEGIILPMKISQDLTKQSAILSLLLNRAETTFYQHQKNFNPNDKSLNDKSLKKIQNAFKDAGMNKVAEKIEKKISSNS